MGVPTRSEDCIVGTLVLCMSGTNHYSNRLISDLLAREFEGRGELERHTGVRAGEPTRTVVFFITILLDLYT